MNTPTPQVAPADRDQVITKGDDAGKTVGQLHAEVFDPKVSDLEYFQRRMAHFQNKTSTPTSS